MRTLLVVLSLAAAGVLLLAGSPGVFRSLVLAVTGWVEVPVFAAVPGAPVINAPPGDLPQGWAALSGEVGGRSMACGFLLELPGGSRLGVSTSHAVPWSWSGDEAVMRAADGQVVVRLGGMLRRGQPAWGRRLALDYGLWSVQEVTQSAVFLQPDPRGQAQVGEAVRVYSRERAAEGGSQSWSAVVMAVEPEVTWIQLEASFNPLGYSGCPVLSAHTGRLVGMAVVGKNRPPVVMGLLPVKILNALP